MIGDKISLKLWKSFLFPVKTKTKLLWAGSLARNDTWFGIKRDELFNEKSSGREFESRPAHHFKKAILLVLF